MEAKVLLRDRGWKFWSEDLHSSIKNPLYKLNIILKILVYDYVLCILTGSLCIHEKFQKILSVVLKNEKKVVDLEMDVHASSLSQWTRSLQKTILQRLGYPLLYGC